MDIEEERKRFERFLPIPYGVMWSVLNGEYIAREEDSIPDADEYNEHFIIWLYAKRDALRPRDARVKPPVCDIEYLVFDPAGREWVRDTANPDDWLEICKDFDDAPFYLPMPPAPEEK